MKKKQMRLLIILVSVTLLLTACKDIKDGIIPESNEDQTIGGNRLTINLTENIQPIRDVYSAAFPRLAMWWLDVYEESAEVIARYDLLLNELDDPYLVEKATDIRLINEDILLLRPISPSERGLHQYRSDSSNPAIAALPTSFFMMHKGAVLTRRISAKTDKIYVSELYDVDENPIFYVGDDISIGRYESAKILSIDEKRLRLTVERGYVREAQSHVKGEKIQAHVRFWPGSWVMNITSACPKEKVPGVVEAVDYITYFHLITQNKVAGLYETIEDNPMYINDKDVAYDGFVIDRFSDHQSWLQWIGEERRPLDIYQDGTLLEDEEIDKLVQETVDQYTELLKVTFGDTLIIRNNAVTLRPEVHDGQVYESSGWDEPNREWWHGLFVNNLQEPLLYGSKMLSYLEWFDVREDALVYMEVYEDEEGTDSNGDGSYRNPYDSPGFIADEQKVRFSLTSTLLGDGFYSYEINTNGHGELGLMWFDFYDNGGQGKGYLGYPLADSREVIDGVHIREYEHGVVLVNLSDENVRPDFSKEVEAAAGISYDSSIGIDSFDGCIFIYK